MLIRIPLLVYAGVVVFFFAIQARLIFPGSDDSSVAVPEDGYPRERGI